MAFDLCRAASRARWCSGSGGDARAQGPSCSGGHWSHPAGEGLGRASGHRPREGAGGIQRGHHGAWEAPGASAGPAGQRGSQTKGSWQAALPEGTGKVRPLGMEEDLRASRNAELTEQRPSCWPARC